MVLGPQEGLALVARTPGAEALVIDAAGALHASAGFRAATQFEPASGARSEATRGFASGEANGDESLSSR